MNQAWYERVPNPGLLADIVMVAHALIILYVIALLVATFIGGPKQWRWVRNPVLRFLHLGIVLIVVVQSLRGRYCPLTYWEDDLREAAGQTTYDTSFIDYWVSQLIYFDLPSWVFMTGYSVFGLLVAISWWYWPPRIRARKLRSRA